MSVQLDLVERLTGEPGGRVCDRDGHDYVIDGPVSFVHETPAALLYCVRCGHRGYHWLPPNVRSRAQKMGMLDEL